jgi:hypothetical protein
MYFFFFDCVGEVGRAEGHCRADDDDDVDTGDDIFDL